MIRFDVPEMTCGHCTAAIQKAIRIADPMASVDCDLAARLVSVDSALEAETLIIAIKEAGYDATALTGD
ncbi:heavy-metal-associated domain-containing protein [Defluviimonas salinarum]|uniref:Heavy-metal-associated domain-containing protein n=1 Tax=Defluviimonas salinarum TaxID=2992147 RepID=A0ABT3J5A0_9RHOB|nr:heavy-metal-associated domain-containing protein [Defluviimonas salinarum]MCW3782867.1 heavy-metal-associated domain-containing protein [Defluviimonas salinarum]